MGSSWKWLQWCENTGIGKQCLSYLVPYCDVRYDFWVKIMFGSTFLPSDLSELMLYESYLYFSNYMYTISISDDMRVVLQ